MVAVFLALAVLAFGGLMVLAYRWTKPPTGGEDLRRADAVQAEERADAATIRDRIRSYVTIYGPKR